MTNSVSPSTKAFNISDRQLGSGFPPYLIAEIGVNHDGDLQKAEALVRAAKKAGADAAKLQAFSPDKLMSRTSPYFGMLSGATLGRAAFEHLYAIGEEIGITVFASVFDEAGADLQAELGAPAFKIASGDLTHLPLLRHVAALRRPIILSTGAATLGEVEVAVDTIRTIDPGAALALLHCVSNYPTAPEDANLACMSTLRSQFNVPVGFSDHTDGVAAPIAAVALGAELIEKHFTLDRGAAGPDHALSADPASLGAIATAMRAANAMVGVPRKAPVESVDIITAIRRSVTAQVDIPAGTRIERHMLEVKRPGNGIAPASIETVVGRVVSRDICADETLFWDHLAPFKATFE